MTKYREILRLKSLGFRDRNVARSYSVSRNTVAKVMEKANELHICWPPDISMTDAALEKLLSSKDKSATTKRMPCLTITISGKNFSEMESTKSFCG